MCLHMYRHYYQGGASNNGQEKCTLDYSNGNYTKEEGAGFITGDVTTAEDGYDSEEDEEGYQNKEDHYSNQVNYSREEEYQGYNEEGENGGNDGQDRDLEPLLAAGHKPLDTLDSIGYLYKQSRL